MDSVVGSGSSINRMRKKKKNQIRDELDRIRHAEKKKRRLEKALAASAAIRSELEKKKQRKLEEQQRLDEEAAAIAEDVALRVLMDKDSIDPTESCLSIDQVDLHNQYPLQFMWKNAALMPNDLYQHEEMNRLYYNDLYYRDMSYSSFSKNNCSYLFGEAARSQYCMAPYVFSDWNLSRDYIERRDMLFGNLWDQWQGSCGHSHIMPSQCEQVKVSGFSVELAAVQAIAALQIAENPVSNSKSSQMIATAALGAVPEERDLIHRFNSFVKIGCGKNP